MKHDLIEYDHLKFESISEKAETTLYGIKLY